MFQADGRQNLWWNGLENLKNKKTTFHLFYKSLNPASKKLEKVQQQVQKTLLTKNSERGEKSSQKSPKSS